MTATVRLTINAIGTPKPKGSLRHVGRGVLIEQVEGSKSWLQVVKAAAWAQRPKHSTPLFTGPVNVAADIRVVRPKSVKRAWPITRSAGDLDKHLRNIGDALEQAGVVADDSIIVSFNGSQKRYPSEGELPGVTVTITPIDRSAA